MPTPQNIQETWLCKLDELGLTHKQRRNEPRKAFGIASLRDAARTLMALASPFGRRNKEHEA
ncbi:hypothetical protein [Nodularia spumigena]|jgi:hypothetical protein|uniref:Uncharacterized protein n=1 Tax=Nodularia spumigena UHCC 0060 TaxID=3110300 RepID=A0ABU5UW33_NODSP|nr:hypothetical protein [Nodularia spumigena]AHJ27341.1 hypothetical protein NSP_9980 [Nodularia spumigena CCY9414]MEA5527511.1 hypothetical protein [Nodularia spumigena UHCC 0143]MEA5610068.1 hypothetical protein [Nodularia spumigena UHCC 0060]